ncbi:MAG: D-2-hydroxyacid dehydrogenase [Candidatus Rokubacteria bacterium]|nr:D-2-hydroxyacid dehydrogenase [Candidatus Rokubacteria bacterium]
MAATRPLRVHVQNNPSANPVFAVTPEPFQAAAKRYPGLARRLTLSYGDRPGADDAGLREAEVLLTDHTPADDLAVRAPRLRWIQSTNAGVEDVLPVLPAGVVLTNASGVHGPKGAEFALTALLMLNHAVPHFVTRQRERRWDQRFTTTIEGKTVVVVGVGALGAEVARLCRRFGLRVLGVRRDPRPLRGVEKMCPPDRLPEVLPRADFLVVTLPLTAQTRGLIGRRELDLLPRHAGVVNLGRGAVVDNGALAEKLRRGELGGAVLDVFDQEPLPPDSPLWTTPNLVITPHCAVDDGVRYVARCLQIFFDNVRRYLAGRPLRNRVDPKLGY